MIINDLVNGITGFLEFEFACHRGYAFNERGFSSQVLQIIGSTSRVSELDCEVPHPVLHKKGIKGRPISVDYAWKQVFDVGGKDRIQQCYLETKWFGFTNPSLTDLVDDVYKLALVSLENKSKCYFLCAGMKSDMNAFCESEINTREVKGAIHKIIRHKRTGTHPDLRIEHLPNKYKFKYKNRITTLPTKVKMMDCISTLTDDQFPGNCCAFGFEVFSSE